MRRVLPRQHPLTDPEPLIARVYAYVAYRIGHGPEAEDITSETFARALRYVDTYDAGKGTPIGWLIGIARRCVNEAHAQPRPGSDPPDRAGPWDMEDDAVDRLTVQAAVQQLGERDRELIALHYGADLSAKQIAQRLEMSTNAVEVALHRARSRLRAALEGEPAGEPAAPPDDGPVRKAVAIPVREARRPNEGKITDAILEARRRPRA
jgi:RNA polymerase sigma-70 factor (ECF subfamily)